MSLNPAPPNHYLRRKIALDDREKVLGATFSGVMYYRTENKLPDNLKVININIDTIGFDPKDAPKVKKLVRLKNRRDKLNKEIKELEDSLVK